MKNKIVNGVLLSYAISLIIACNPGKKESTVTVVDKEKIKMEISGQGRRICCDLQFRSG